jgi:ABC-type molybdate transport system substrate-binding protein
VIVISRSPHKQDAVAFLDYIKTTEGSAVLERYGFTVPEKKQETAK